MLAAACALLAALLAAPGAALAPGSCPALGKGSARTWRPRQLAGGGTAGLGARRGGGAPFLWPVQVPAGTAEGPGRPSRSAAGGARGRLRAPCLWRGALLVAAVWRGAPRGLRTGPARSPKPEPRGSQCPQEPWRDSEGERPGRAQCPLRAPRSPLRSGAAASSGCPVSPLAVCEDHSARPAAKGLIPWPLSDDPLSAVLTPFRGHQLCKAVPSQGTLTNVGQSARDWDILGLAGAGLRSTGAGAGGGPEGRGTCALLTIICPWRPGLSWALATRLAGDSSLLSWGRCLSRGFF